MASSFLVASLYIFGVTCSVLVDIPYAIHLIPFDCCLGVGYQRNQPNVTFQRVTPLTSPQKAGQAQINSAKQSPQLPVRGSSQPVFIPVSSQSASLQAGPRLLNTVSPQPIIINNQVQAHRCVLFTLYTLSVLCLVDQRLRNTRINNKCAGVSVKGIKCYTMQCQKSSPLSYHSVSSFPCPHISCVTLCNCRPIPVLHVITQSSLLL